MQEKKTRRDASGPPIYHQREWHRFFGYFGAKMALLIQNISAKLEISKYTRKNAFDIDIDVLPPPTQKIC